MTHPWHLTPAQRELTIRDQHARVGTMLEAYAKLPARAQLQLIRDMLSEFSGYSYGYDRAIEGVEMIAVDTAEEDGWSGEDLAARYLEEGPYYRFERLTKGIRL